MAVETYIVTQDDFINRANLSANLYTPRFKQESGIEQERFAVKILCSALYDQLLIEIASDTLTANNNALMPFLKDYLVFKIYSSYLVDGNLLATASGMRTQIDSTSEKATEEEMARAISKAQSRANFYEQKLLNFLECNKDNYPLWKDTICACQGVVKKANKFSKIGKSRGKTKINWT